MTTHVKPTPEMQERTKDWLDQPLPPRVPGEIEQTVRDVEAIIGAPLPELPPEQES